MERKRDKSSLVFIESLAHIMSLEFRWKSPFSSGPADTHLIVLPFFREIIIMRVNENENFLELTLVAKPSMTNLASELFVPRRLIWLVLVQVLMIIVVIVEIDILILSGGSLSWNDRRCNRSILTRFILFLANYSLRRHEFVPLVGFLPGRPSFLFLTLFLLLICDPGWDDVELRRWCGLVWINRLSGIWNCNWEWDWNLESGIGIGCCIAGKEMSWEHGSRVCSKDCECGWVQDGESTERRGWNAWGDKMVELPPFMLSPFMLTLHLLSHLLRVTYLLHSNQPSQDPLFLAPTETSRKPTEAETDKLSNKNVNPTTLI